MDTSETFEKMLDGAMLSEPEAFMEFGVKANVQDQLQILSGLSWYLFDKTCVTWATTNPDYQSESKEIVGLRVVMHTIYDKQWLDNEWILDKTI